MSSVRHPHMRWELVAYLTAIIFVPDDIPENREQSSVPIGSLLARTLVLVVAAMFGSSSSASDVQKLARCEEGVEIVDATAPELPVLTENSAEGTVVVQVVIGVKGQVLSARLQRSSITKSGRGGAPQGYESAAVDAVRKWTFSAPRKRCVREVFVEYALAASDPDD